jgi:hypothetical protein
MPFDYPNKAGVDQIMARFPAGSIVYQPTRAPAGVFDATTYPYAELIAKNVKERINSSHAVIGHGGEGVPEIPDLTGITLRPGFPAASIPFIVGLYEGGAGNKTGMFHATGNCVMNSTGKGARYCHVCRYVLVDAIDPSKHYFIDPDHDEIYPQA